DGVERRRAGLPGGDLLAGIPGGQLRLPSLAAACRDDEVEFLGELTVAGSERVHALLPCVSLWTAADARAPVVIEDVVGDPEVLGWHPEDLLHLGDFVGAEGTAVRVRGVRVLGRRITDVAAQDQQRGAVFDRYALTQAALERVEILGDLAELHD